MEEVKKFNGSLAMHQNLGICVRPRQKLPHWVKNGQRLNQGEDLESTPNILSYFIPSVDA